MTHLLRLEQITLHDFVDQAADAVLACRGVVEDLLELRAVAEADIWLYFLRFAEKIDTEALPAALQQPSMMCAVEELKMLTHTDIELVSEEDLARLVKDLEEQVSEDR